MQAYNRIFARVYNLRWAGFANQVAPRLLAFYSRTPVGSTNRDVLDLCCGTGQLAQCFLEKGYCVTGLDLSEYMLEYARENTRAYVESGQARFVQGDASSFALDGHFGLVVSTYDALNHLPDEQALRNCFQCVGQVLVEDGYFIFDLNTRRGLRRWSGVTVDDGEEVMIVTRGVYDEEHGKACTEISGFVREEDGRYERFRQVAYNTAFELTRVKNALLELGWREVHLARLADLSVPADDPESEGRVFFVARR